MLMRKVVLMLALGLTCGPALAEWTFAVEGDGTKTYVNLASIRKTGDTVKMWVLNDFNKVQKVGKKKFLSSASQLEFDCADGTLSTTSMLDYAGHMAKGHVVYNNDFYDPPSPVPPDSVGERLLKVACDNS